MELDMLLIIAGAGCAGIGLIMFLVYIFAGKLAGARLNRKLNEEYRS